MPVYFKGHRQLSWHSNLKSSATVTPPSYFTAKPGVNRWHWKSHVPPVQTALRGNVITGYLSGTGASRTVFFKVWWIHSLYQNAQWCFWKYVILGSIPDLLNLNQEACGPGRCICSRLLWEFFLEPFILPAMLPIWVLCGLAGIFHK